MMAILQARGHSRDASGLTLIEVIVAASLTAFLAVGIGRVFSNLSYGLEIAADRSLSAQMLVKFSSSVKYDFAGARDVVVFGATPPGASSSLCSSWKTDSLASRWTDPSRKDFTLPLFTLQISDTNYDQLSAAAPVWQPVGSHTTFAGYEIRRSDFASAKKAARPLYQIWRVTCPGPSGSPGVATSPSSPVWTVGPRLPSALVNASGVLIAGGNGIVLCDGGPCVVGSSTFATAAYSLAPPYTGDAYAGLRRPANSLATLTSLQTLKRRVDI